MSKGAQDQVVVTKRVCLVGKFPLIELNPQSWQEYKMDPDKKAPVINWLSSSHSSLDISVEDQEIIKVHQMLLQYHNDEGIPQIEDTEFVSAMKPLI